MSLRQIDSHLEQYEMQVNYQTKTQIRKEKKSKIFKKKKIKYFYTFQLNKTLKYN